MRDLLSRRHIRQSTRFQRVVIDRIRFIAMIDESQVAPDVKSIPLVQPQHMLTIFQCGNTIKDTGQLTCADMATSEKPFVVEWSILPGRIGFGSLEPSLTPFISLHPLDALINENGRLENQGIHIQLPKIQRQ
jgi:hypothetical protein